MGIMAGGTQLVGIVNQRFDLWKSRGASGIVFVADGAVRSLIGYKRLVFIRSLSVIVRRAVTDFARKPLMIRSAFYLLHFIMALHADDMSGIMKFLGGDRIECGRAEMTQVAEGGRDEKMSRDYYPHSGK